MKIIHNIGYNLAGSLVPIIAALLTIPFFIELAGAARYGVLSLALLFLGYFGLFDFGLGRATNYRLSGLRDAEPSQRGSVAWTSCLSVVPLGLVGGALLWAGLELYGAIAGRNAGEFQAEIEASAVFLALSVPVSLLISVLTGVLQAEQKFAKLNVITTVSAVLFQTLPLVGGHLIAPTLPVFIASALSSRLIGLVWLALEGYRAFRGAGSHFSRDELGRLASFGGWVFLDGVLTPILATIDRFAVGAVLGARAVTIYTVPSTLAQRISILPSAVVQAIFPSLPSAGDRERAQFALTAQRALLATMSLPLLVAVYLFIPFFRFWLGGDLGQAAAEVGVIIIVAYWVNALVWVPLHWLQASGRPDVVTKAHLLQSAPYVVALYFSLRYGGLQALAILATVRNVIDLILMSYFAGQSSALKLVVLPGLLLALGAAATLTLSYGGQAWFIVVLVSTAGMAFLSYTLCPPEVRYRLAKLLPKRASLDPPH